MEARAHAADHEQRLSRHLAQTRPMENEVRRKSLRRLLQPIGESDRHAAAQGPSCQANIIVAKALLVGLVAGAAVEEPDAVPRRMHQKLTLMDRPDAIGGEIDIVSGEPSGQYAVGAERQIK